jgi:glucosamine--fructose-6-phosphate aminotransferase (isomerizing)
LTALLPFVTVKNRFLKPVSYVLWRASVTASTRFLQDILRQPVEMQRTIEHLSGPAQAALQQGSSLIRAARDVILTGIGASWHAALSAGSMFFQGGRPVYMQEAGELLHFTTIPEKAVVVAISRTGRSIEIVQLLAKAKASGASVIGITNSADSPLAQESSIAIVMPIKLDHAISVNTYSTLLIAASALASSVTTGFGSVANALLHSVSEAGRCLELWQEQLEKSAWLAPGVPYYFLARGGSLGTCHEARLLWEEGVKAPATAMSTSSFRHGPQEIVKDGMRFCLWIQQEQMRDEDLAVADDLRRLGASVMLIGEKLPCDAAGLVCQLPGLPPHWQPVIDVLPVQLAAERLSRLSGVDCDSFRICSYIVEDEHGLLGKKEASPNAE